jgi:hypothetical protein
LNFAIYHANINVFHNKQKKVRKNNIKNIYFAAESIKKVVHLQSNNRVVTRLFKSTKKETPQNVNFGRF